LRKLLMVQWIVRLSLRSCVLGSVLVGPVPFGMLSLGTVQRLRYQSGLM
jgi:hypothetical protein